MNINHILTHHYMQALTSTPQGRAHVLAQLAEAESSGEAKIFDDLLVYVEDDQLQKMVRRHRDDEIRHANMFEKCLKRTGVGTPEQPPELQVMYHLDKSLGGFFDRPIQSDEDVLRAYLVLQVIEERAMEQFGQLQTIFSEVDPDTAMVLAEVAADEVRHLRYCQAISRKYAKSEQERVEKLKEFRTLEAEAYQTVQIANMKYIQDQQLMPKPVEGWFLGQLRWLSKVMPIPKTPFAGHFEFFGQAA